MLGCNRGNPEIEQILTGCYSYENSDQPQPARISQKAKGSSGKIHKMDSGVEVYQEENMSKELTTLSRIISRKQLRDAQMMDHSPLRNQVGVQIVRGLL